MLGAECRDGDLPDLFRVNLGSAVNYVNLGSTLSEAILGLAPTNFGLAPSIRREAAGFYRLGDDPCWIDPGSDPSGLQGSVVLLNQNNTSNQHPTHLANLRVPSLNHKQHYNPYERRVLPCLILIILVTPLCRFQNSIRLLSIIIPRKFNSQRAPEHLLKSSAYFSALNCLL
jgi:hypothetical protein